MGLGKPQRKDLQAFSLKIKTKDLPKPAFEVSKKVGDKFEKLPDLESSVSGNIIGIEPRETKWEGKVIKSVNVTLTDKDQIYFLSVPYSSLGRTLMNTLLNLKSFNDVEISLYQTKPKVEGGKTYPQSAVRQGGELVRWKFDIKDLPQPKEITFKGETIRDFSEQENFFAAQLKEFSTFVKNNLPVQEEKPATTAPASQDNEDDDVPF